MVGALLGVYYLVVTFTLAEFSIEASGDADVVVDERCTNNRHIVGQWVEKAPTKKSFQCCGWQNKEDYLWNTSLCGNVSYLVDDNTNFYRGSTLGSTQAGASSCVCDSAKNTRTTVSERESYVWEPSMCSLVPFDGKIFCSLLGNRTILLIGDSIMQQLASTIMSMVTASDGHCADQIILSRSNYIYFESPVRLDHMVDIIRPNITIFHSGAHMRDIGDMKTLWHWLKPQISRIRNTTSYNQLAWVTQAPGHQHCMHFQQPRPFKFASTRPPMDRFGWYNFPHFDTYSIDQVNQLRLKLIDLSPLYWRIDGHFGGDCLHYCLPGPLDLFAILVNQMLVTGEL